MGLFVEMKPLKTFQNDQHEGLVRASGKNFFTTELRAKSLARLGLAVRVGEADPRDSAATPSLPVGPAESLHSPLLIVIPAWQEHYRDYATKYVLPSVKIALENRKARNPARFLVHTDKPAAFGPALKDFDVTYHVVSPSAGFNGLTTAHKAAVSLAPVGSIVMLLNADIMVSNETFVIADLAFARGYKAIASIGMRSVLQSEEPPIGGSARQLLDWSWRNRHPIAEDGVFGRGKTQTPTTIFFEQGDSVVVHCFHLHPFFVLKDRPINFTGTIDDDLLAKYEGGEIFVLREREIGFAELSLKEKWQQSGTPLSIETVVQGGRHYIPAHVRNFRNQIRVVGEGEVNSDTARIIADGIAKKWSR